MLDRVDNCLPLAVAPVGTTTTNTTNTTNTATTTTTTTDTHTNTGTGTIVSPLNASPTPTHTPTPKPTLCLVVIDEIDALGRGDGNITCSLLKATLCRWMDKQQVSRSGCGGMCMGITNGGVAVVATTNRPNDVDSKMRRGGRLDAEIDVLATSAADRVVLLQYYMRYYMGLSAGVGLGLGGSRIYDNECTGSDTDADTDSASDVILAISEEVGYKTGGFVAADLKALVSVAVEEYTNSSVVRGTTNSNSNSISNSNSNSSVPNRDLLLNSMHVALDRVQPSCLRGITIQLDSQVQCIYV